MKLSSQHRLFLSLLLLLAGIIGATKIALNAPMLDIRISQGPNDTLLVSPTSPHTAALFAADSTIESLGSIPLNPQLLIEEPDQLPSWSEYNAVMHNMTQLAAESNAASLTAQIDGKAIILPVRERTLLDLPGLFWLQVSIAGLAFLIAAGVYSFRPKNAGAKHFFFAGLFIGISALSASVYSSREIILDGDTFLFLSRANQLGAVFFTAALVALLSQYPKPLFKGFRFTLLFYLLGLLGWLGFASQLYPDPSSVYAVVLLLFSISFVLAYKQWQKTRHSPVERASLKWYLLSIYIGTGLFAIFILIPVALGITPPASQGVMFLVFLAMFIGIALGIIRYRLFDLDRWWFNAWSWFLGGVFIIALDALLIMAIGLSTETALALSLALVGWIYFPLRQWLMAKLFKSAEKQNDHINRLIEKLFSAQTAQELSLFWQSTLAETWYTLSFEESIGKRHHSQIKGEGQILEVPHLSEDRYLIFSYPNQGSRLFNQEDLATAELFYQIGQQALAGLSVRQQAIEEKNRIFSDLHDDVGAKLLSILYKTEDPDLNEITRSALQDLREIVSQPDASRANLNEQVSRWQQEMRLRLKDAQIKLHWTQTQLPHQMVSTLTLNHIMRILREATNNIIKHAHASEVKVSLELAPDLRLNIQITDNGLSQDPQHWVLGRGTRNIRHRSQLLGGEATWQKAHPQGCQVNLILPFQPKP